MKFLREYVRYVTWRWWWIVVGGVGGIFTVLALAAAVTVPTWLGLVVLFGGLLPAQAFAFKDVRDERETLREELAETRRNPKALLRDRYVAGRKLQERIALRVGAASEAKLQDIENTNRTDAYRWAKATWEVLQEHFPGYEQDFMGPERTVVVKAFHVFDAYCEGSIQRHYGNSTDRFLEAKLDFVAALVDKTQ